MYISMSAYVQMLMLPDKLTGKQSLSLSLSLSLTHTQNTYRHTDADADADAATATATRARVANCLIGMQVSIKASLRLN